MSHPYYREHLAFLLEGGRAMAGAFPRAASMLAEVGLDPDVERLLEGIAFISSKVSERKEQSLDEFCQLLFDILYPHYLCQVPAASIVQFEGPPCTVERGTKVESVPVLGTSCQFQTIYPISIAPLALRDVGWQMRGGQSAQLTLHFEESGGGLDQHSCDRLSLYLHGEDLLTRSLYCWLRTCLESIELLGPEGETLATREAPRVRSRGFSDVEALLPYPPCSFSGFRLLQEYFVLPEKFMFVSLEELTPLLSRLPAGSSEPRQFSLRLNMKTDETRSFVVTRQNIRLNCTPVVNMFAHTADPIQRSPGKSDFLVRPAGHYLHHQVYRVLKVIGRSLQGVVRYPLVSELDPQRPEQTFCQIHRKLRGSESFFFVSLSDGGVAPAEQILLFDLLCTDGALPSGLQVGDICRPEATYLKCHNITSVTEAVPAPIGEELRRRLIKHLAVSQRDLTTLEALRDTFDLYNTRTMINEQAARGHALLVDGLLELTSRTAQCRHHAVPVWGQVNRLVLEESAFDNDGELYLFGCLLDEFFALQAPINFWSELSVHGARSAVKHRWPKRLGSRPLDSI
jgi:type VI secretion system protein ImpG